MTKSRGDKKPRGSDYKNRAANDGGNRGKSSTSVDATTFAMPGRKAVSAENLESHALRSLKSSVASGSAAAAENALLVQATATRASRGRKDKTW